MKISSQKKRTKLFNINPPDISKDKSGMDFIKNTGHSTVPQLYWNSTWVNKDTNTASLSPTSLSNLITEAIDNERAAGFVA